MSIFEDIDTSHYGLYKQCEIRRDPTPGNIVVIDLQEKEPPYSYDIVWIKADIAKKGAQFQDSKGRVWTIYEVYGTRRMPFGRSDLKEVKVEFETVTSPKFAHSEMEMKAYDMPITKIIEDNSVKKV